MSLKMGVEFFFFQAEDGIRDADVTGVQTCALPICSAINQSVAGDVILYEMQTGGVNATQTVPNYVPAEYVNSIWDATKAATTAGIHIVAAAGNGDQNLDYSSYTSYINRGDSGALIIEIGRAHV